VPGAVQKFWIESTTLTSAKKQTIYGPASTVSLYGLSCIESNIP